VIGVQDETRGVRLIVDVANVMGSRPDGWWRDRAAAATRWLADLDGLVGRSVSLPEGALPDARVVILSDVVAVIEGQARAAQAPDGAAVRVVRAPRDGDSTVVEATEQALRDDVRPVVVTADRGLRDRLPPGAVVVGPGWLLRLAG
jgi:hypothetical protein